MSAFSSGDKIEGRKEVERIWARSKKNYKYSTPEDIKRWQEEIDQLPIFSLMPQYSNYIKLDPNPNI